MRTSNKAAIAMALLALFGLLLWALRPGPAGRVDPMARRPAERAAVEAPASSPKQSPEGAVEQEPEAAAPSPAVPARAPASPRALPGEVSGHVLVLPDRTPAAGATVALAKSEGLAEGAVLPGVTSAPTGADGGFRLGGFPAGTYTFEVTHESFPQRAFRAVMEEDSGVAGIEVLLLPGGGIEGRVADSKGAPGAGLAVWIDRGNPAVRVATTRTDADGQFRFEHVLPGSYEVCLRREPPPAPEHVVSVSVVEGQVTRLDFAGQCALAGVLMDRDGGPVPKAIVAARRPGGAFTYLQSGTDDAGRYRIEGMEPGEWSIKVQIFGAGAFVAEVARVSVVPGENEFDIRLGQGDRTGEIAGRVTRKSTGEPLTMREVQLSLLPLVERKEGVWTRDAGQAGMAFADRDGNFRFQSLPAGRFRIAAYSRTGNQRTCERDVELGPGQRVEGIEVALEDEAPPIDPSEAGVVSGTLLDSAGKTVPGMLVRAERATGPYRSLDATTDDAGQYRIAGLMPGRWRLSVLAAGPRGFYAVLAERTVVKGANRVDLRLGDGEIAGRITGKATGEPLSVREVQMSLFPLDGGGAGAQPGAAAAGMAFPDPEGSFRFRGLGAGRYRLVVHSSTGLRDTERDIDLGPGERKEGVDFLLETPRTGTVLVVLRDEAGRPVEEATLRLVVSRVLVGQGSTSTYATLDPARPAPGTCEVQVEPGARELVASKSGHRPAILRVDVREGETTTVEAVMHPVEEPR